MKVVRTIEWLLLSLGVLLVASYVVIRLHGIVSSRAAVSSFHVPQKVFGTRADRITGEPYLPPPQNVDFGLWSEKRIFEYQLSLARYSAAPLALLRIGKLHVEVPVFDGTDDLTLNRGVGRHRHGETRRTRQYRCCGSPERIFPRAEGYPFRG